MLRLDKMDWVRPAILGFLDGAVTSIALVAFSLGVAPESVLWFGIAGWLAGSISMSVNEFVSVSDQNRSEGTNYSPLNAAISSFLAFSVGALIPLIPLFMGAATYLGLITGFGSVFVGGVVMAKYTKRGVVSNGFRMAAFAGVAVVASLLVGAILGVQA